MSQHLDMISVGTRLREFARAIQNVWLKIEHNFSLCSIQTQHGLVARRSIWNVVHGGGVRERTYNQFSLDVSFHALFQCVLRLQRIFQIPQIFADCRFCNNLLNTAKWANLSHARAMVCCCWFFFGFNPIRRTWQSIAYLTTFMWIYIFFAAELFWLGLNNWTKSHIMSLPSHRARARTLFHSTKIFHRNNNLKGEFHWLIGKSMCKFLWIATEWSCQFLKKTKQNGNRQPASPMWESKLNWWRWITFHFYWEREKKKRNTRRKMPTQNR